jgi:uncharacterized protein YfbU (UPF0304 family)
MKLSRIERLMLSNQFLILESLYPNEAQGYAEQRQAIEKGYELHYENSIQHIYNSTDIMSESECKEVIDILSIFDEIKLSYERLSEKSGIDELKINFPGFDGNNESKQLSYAKYYCKHDGGRFSSLKIINSHFPVLERYLRMIIIWKKIKQQKKIEQDGLLTKHQIIEILDA